MTRPHYKTVFSYLGAIAIVMAATLIRLATDSLLGDRQPFAVFLVAVIIASRLFGFGPSLLALFLSALASRYFFLSPRASLAIVGLDQQASFAFFILFGTFFAFLMRAEQKARSEAERQTSVAVQKQQELSVEIAERHRIEAELRASLERFHRFVDFGPFAAFMKDHNGKYVYVNKFVERIFRREQVEFLGKTDQDVFPGERASEYVANDLRALQENATVHFEETTQSPDGIIQHWSTLKFPLRDVPGRLLLGGVCIDITESRNAELRAKESEARLNLALDIGRLGWFVWQMTTNRVCSSETFAVLHGLSCDHSEMILDEAIANIHPDDIHVMEDAIERSLKDEAPDRITYRVVWPDGSIHWVEGIASVFKNELGEPIRVIGVCADITERMCAEKALKTSEERFRLLALHSPVGIVEADAQGGCVFVNRKWCEMAGISAEQAFGEGWKVAVHPDDRERIVNEWSDAVKAGREYVCECRLMRPNGDVVCIYCCSIVLLNESGLPQSYVSTVVDITDLKRAQKVLESKQDLLRNLIEVQENEKQFLCHEFHDGLIQYAV